MSNKFNFIYSKLTTIVQLSAIPMALLAVIVGYLFFQPTSYYWEIPVIMLKKVCKEDVAKDTEFTDCEVSEVLVWSGRDQSEIRILAKTKSHEILNSLFANQMAASKQDRDIVSARIQNASEYFTPESEALSRFVLLGRSSLNKSDRYKSYYKAFDETVTYFQKGFWIYRAKLTIVWEDASRVQDSEEIEISIRWIPVRDKLRNDMAQAIAVSKLELREARK